MDHCFFLISWGLMGGGFDMEGNEGRCDGEGEVEDENDLDAPIDAIVRQRVLCEGQC